jgi:hypothetical protein
MRYKGAFAADFNLAAWKDEAGKMRLAEQWLRRSLERIEHPYLCETFLFVSARHAAESDLARVSEIAGHPSRPRSHPLCAATIALVEALIDVRRQARLGRPPSCRDASAKSRRSSRPGSRIARSRRSSGSRRRPSSSTFRRRSRSWTSRRAQLVAALMEPTAQAHDRAT